MVESALSRLDGVENVSAGWQTNAAAITMRPDARLERKAADVAVRKAGFAIIGWKRLR